MNIFEFKIRLEMIPQDGRNDDTTVIMVDTLPEWEQKKICKHCSGEFDWLDRTVGEEPFSEEYVIQQKIMAESGFTNNDITMDAEFKGGKLCVTILTDKDFNELRDVYECGKHIKQTLLDCVKSEINGCLSDGIGENGIGNCIYNGREYEIWFGPIETNEPLSTGYNSGYFKVIGTGWE